MTNANSQIPFDQAIAAMDAGDITLLEKLVQVSPLLLSERMAAPAHGYFKQPYLLWFVADNPIRNNTLPVNIVAIAQWLIDSIQQKAPETFQEQVDYALALVCSGRVPRECGVQLALVDILIDAGARPGSGNGALAHGNIEAARHLIERGAAITLLTAVCMGMDKEAAALLTTAVEQERCNALVAAAFYGNTAKLQWLLAAGTNPNGWPQDADGFHVHATALHQAVSAGSLPSVRLLVNAGASTEARDKMYNGTPLDWAIHMEQETETTEKRSAYTLIACYLRSL